MFSIPEGAGAGQGEGRERLSLIGALGAGLEERENGGVPGLGALKLYRIAGIGTMRHVFGACFLCKFLIYQGGYPDSPTW